MEIIKLLQENIREVACEVVSRLKDNQVGVIPSDTSYGMATLIRRENIDHLLKIKGRSRRKPISVFVSSLEFLDELAVVDYNQRQFIKNRLNKSHTFVLELESQFKDQYKDIAPDGKIGIRIVGVPLIREILKKLNEPITATSANLSNHTNCYSLKGFLNQFEDKAVQPDFFIDAGKLPYCSPSTVIDLTTRPYRIIRK